MTRAQNQPTREEFMRLSREEIIAARVTPATIAVGVGGTRRHAILAGVDPHSDEYPEYSRQGMMRYFELLFSFGVQHIFTTAIRPYQLLESGRYGARLLDWVAEGLAGDTALRDNERRGWRVRMTGVDAVPELREAANRLVEATPANWSHTVWWSLASDADTPWRSILEAVQRSGARTRQDAIVALYGEPVPLCTMYLAFGKPIAASDLLPPLLSDDVQCYWSQRPGYSLTEAMWRDILYDYAYARRTRAPDTAKRDLAVLEDRAAWENAGVLGIGRSLGPFWFPRDNQ